MLPFFCRQWKGLAQFRYQPVAGPHDLPHSQTYWTMTDMNADLRASQTQGTDDSLGVLHLNATVTTCNLCPALRDCPIRTHQTNPSKPHLWSWNLQTVRGWAIWHFAGWILLIPTSSGPHPWSWNTSCHAHCSVFKQRREGVIQDQEPVLFWDLDGMYSMVLLSNNLM